jgi:MFS family permease
VSEPHGDLMVEAPSGGVVIPKATAPATPAMADAEPLEHGARSLLGNSKFRRLWLGQAVSELGDGMAGLALVVLVHRLAGSASAIAALAIMTSVPQLVLGLHAGVFVDRWDRRRVMIASDLARAGLALALVAMRDPSQLGWVYALAIAQAAAGVFFEPARTAFLPAVVAPQARLAANGFCQTTRVVSMTTGAALAGLLLTFPSGMAWVFGLDALSFALSAAALWSIRMRAVALDPTGAPTGRDGTTAELLSGLRLLFANPVLVGLLLTFAITVLGMGAISVLFVPFMLRDLHASTAAIGFVRAAQTAGMVAGAAWLAGPGARLPPAKVLGLGILALGPCLAIMGVAPHWSALLPMLAIAGICSSAIQVGSATLLQLAVPDRARGRAESTLDTLLALVMMVAMAVAGGAADRFGTRIVFVAAGALALTGGLVGRAWLSSHRRVTNAIAP